MILPMMIQCLLPEHVLVDLRRFISENYHNDLPHSLLIAQGFILKCPDPGEKYGLSKINDAVEYLIK